MSIREALAVLGLYPGATRPEIKTAYRDMVKRWHPDHFANEPEMREEAEEQIQKINFAYHVLRDYKYERSALEQEIMSGSWVPYEEAAAQETPIAPGPDKFADPKQDVFVAPKASSKRWAKIAVGLGGAIVALAAILFSFRDRPEHIPSPATATAPAVKDAAAKRATDDSGLRAHDSQTGGLAKAAGDSRNQAQARETAPSRETVAVVAPIRPAAVTPPVGQKPPAAAPVTTPVRKTVITEPAAPARTPIPAKKSSTPVAAPKPPASQSSRLAKPDVLKPQIAVSSHTPDLPALSGLDKADKRSIELACSDKTDTKSPTAHRECLIRQLRATPRAIHLH